MAGWFDRPRPARRTMTECRGVGVDRHLVKTECASMSVRFILLPALLFCFGAASLIAQDLTVTPLGWVESDNAPDALPDRGAADDLDSIPEKLEGLTRPTYARISEVLAEDGAPLSRSMASEFPWLENQARKLFMASRKPKPAKRGGESVASEVEYFLVFNPATGSKKASRSTPRLLRPATVFVSADPAAPKTIFREFELQIDATGQATTLKPISEKIGSAVLAAVKATLPKWQFAPAYRDGKPIAAVIIVPVLCVQRTLIESTAADVRPQAIFLEPPAYPFLAKREGVTGRVLLSLTIGIDGRTRDVHVIQSSHRMFDVAGVAAIKRWRYRPALKDGVPVAVRFLQPISFSLEETPETTPFTVPYDAKKLAKLPPALQWDKAPVYSEIGSGVYPYELLNAGKEGHVQLAFVVGPNGRVVESQAVQATDPAFAGAAVAMIETFKFEPASNRGKPAHALLGLRVNFSRLGTVLVPCDHQMVQIAHRLTTQPASFTMPEDLDRPLECWMPLNAKLPLRAKGQLSGSAVVRYVVDASGLVQAPRVISASSPEIGFAAVQGVATLRFAQPQKSGHGVEVLVTDEITLTPEGATRVSR